MNQSSTGQEHHLSPSPSFLLAEAPQTQTEVQPYSTPTDSGGTSEPASPSTRGDIPDPEFVQHKPQSRPQPQPQRQSRIWAHASTQLPRVPAGGQDMESIPMYESGTNKWSQRLNMTRSQSQGFIWDSLDNDMDEVQEARKTRKNGPIRLLTNRKDTSYNSVRSTFRLQYAEKRRSDIHNFVSSIRLGLDYDVYKSKVMALLNSKARTIFFIIIDLIVDLLFCILYLVECQSVQQRKDQVYPDPNWLFVPRIWTIWAIAVAMSSWNLMSAFIRFIFADNKWRFIFSIQTLLDTVTAVPFVLSGAFMPNGQYVYVPYFLRSWSVISRLQRALNIGVDIGISDQPFDHVKAKLIALVAYFIAILYNGMAAFLYCESMFAPADAKPNTVGDAFYFILITASTVGYGDITPKSFEAKIVVMAFIIVALSVVPGLIAGTIETIKSSRSGGGSYTQSRGANGAPKQYLVMIGDFQSAKRVGDMLSGFFNKEFSESDVRVVFLSRNKPSREVKTLLDMPMHKNRTTMLVGNGLDESDLKRCQVRDAGAVFVIPDLTASGLESQDTMTTLLAWSIHIYAPNTRIFTYNRLPETESFQWGVVEKSMCISDIKQLLLAYNCRHRGSATLILNLLHPSEPANSYDEGWQAQYGDGTGNELYVGPVPSVFIGWTFAQMSWFVFQEFQSILIGIDIFLKAENGFAGEKSDGLHHHDSSHQGRPRSQSRSRSRSNARGLYEFDTSHDCPTGQYHLTLNPGNSYRLGKFDQLIYIAQSPNDVDAITKFTMDQYERLVKDEKGYLEASRIDFARSNAMFQHLRDSRTGARAAAKKRAEQRKRTKRMRQGESEMAAQENAATAFDYEVLSTSQPWTEHHGPVQREVIIGTHTLEQEELESRTPSRYNSSSSKFGTVPKKPRPAWNVALYDDSDHDDDVLSDSSSLRKVQTAESTLSRHNRRSRQSRDQEYLVGAIEREMRGYMSMSPSQSKFMNAPASSLGITSVGTSETGSPMLHDPEFCPSNFDQNAAAAAARDGLPQGSQGSQSKQRLSVGESVRPAMTGLPTDSEQGSVGRTKFFVSGTPEGTMEVSNKITLVTIQPTTMQKPSSSTPLSAPRPSMKGRKTFTSVEGSFQNLEELTYVDQTSITRSETKDLPLCHLLINPPDSLKPLIKEDLTNLRNHIVVCADTSENLYRFLATLRLAQIKLEDLKTIVVLSKNPLELYTSDSCVVTDHDTYNDCGARVKQGSEGSAAEDWMSDKRHSGGNWDAILSFPRVFWVAGNCRRQRDLVRAGILGASSVVIMSHSMEGLERDEFADSTAIMSHHMVYQTLRQRGLLGRQHIIVEIAERTNIRFLNMHDVNGVKRRDGALSKVTRGGRSNGFVMSPLFASGQVLVSSLLDNVLFQAYSKTHILDLVKLCCGVRFKQAIELDQILGIDSSNICLIDTPAEFVGQSFLKLFQGLALLYGIVPLGLYRAPDKSLNNHLPFVFTNPLPGILLTETDMVYVLKS
ncbi:potassium channel, sub T, member 2 [Podila humilis]|nr:potassium channel, sub T, member 2 [Podila humilis]